jgi:hypothetical protein
VLGHHAGGDHALEQLLLQHRAIRQCGPLAGQLAGGELYLVVELEPGDDFTVDHRQNAIDEHRLDRTVGSVNGLHRTGRDDGHKQLTGMGEDHGTGRWAQSLRRIIVFVELGLR